MSSFKLMDFVSNVANEVAQRLPSSLASIPATIQEHAHSNLDVTYITDRILATSKPAEAPVSTRNDVGRDKHSSFTIDTTATALTLPQQDADDGGSQQDSLTDTVSQPQHMPIKPKAGVNPGALSTFLTKRHGTNFLALNLSEEDPDDRTRILLNRQILTCGWSSPCIQKSETPRLPHILDIMYAIHAYLTLDQRNVICVYCANGRTRTAIVIACYLQFSNVVTTSLDGFRLFLSKRCPHLDPNETLDNIPPSLITFFRNFDSCIRLGTVMNPKPLLLRAIAVQGVPVDDKPCIDIWDSKEQHVYASNNDDSLSQWADEEGFYRVNCVLEGDFVLLCRFGGPYMDETNDPSKVLFRYANTTGFLASGPYELPKSKVDMMRRYVQSFDEEDFSLTLLMESYWDCTDEQHKEQLQQKCNGKVMPPVLKGRDAKEKGWHLITERHVARPEMQDVETLTRAFPELKECPPHVCKLALQLTNFNLGAARDMLYEGSMESWWRNKPLSDTSIQNAETQTEEEPPATADPPRAVTPTPDQRCLDILAMIDEVEGIDSSDSVLDDVSLLGNAATTKRPREHHPDDGMLRYQPMMYANRGDIVNAFGDYYKQIHAQSGQPKRVMPRRSLELGCRPRVPLIPRKRIRPHDMAAPHKRPTVDPFGQIGGFQNPGGANGDLVYDEDFMAAMELYQQVNHTGVTLQDLRRVQAVSREWNRVKQPSTEQAEIKENPSQAVVDTAGGSEHVERELVASQGDQTSIVALPSGTGEGMTGGGAAGGVGSVAGREGATSIATSSTSVEGATSGGGNVSSTETSSTATEARVDGGINKGETGEVAASDKKVDSTDEVPLRLDPEYEKYFKMLKIGMPMEVVKHAMKRDEKDPGIMDLDHDKSLKSQQKEPVAKESSTDDDGPALKDDPEFAKYFKMLKMGLPMDAVKHAMKRDERDPGIMDLDHDKSLKSQQKQAEDSIADDGPALKDDPEYVKYFKMLKMGLPAGAVKNALQRDGKDPSVIDLDPEKSLKSQKDSPVEEKDDGPPLCEDPQFTKYFKMLKMGLPLDAVKNALQRDGKDPTIMDLDHNKSLKSQTKNEVIDTGIALKDDPEYTKYFKMLQMGIPMGAVKNALQRDEKDPSIMDLDPDKSVAFQLSQKSGRLIHRKKEKKRVRRKKIYWTPIDPGKVNEESIWSMVRGAVVMDDLKYDPKEFENLFTESSNPADKKKAAARKEKSSQTKKTVQVIDGKRSMNGGIILARLKMDYSKIAEMVDVMDSGKFDSTQLSALKEFLPTQDERKALQEYMKKGDVSPQAKAEALSALSECEKYMVAMMEVDNAASKFDCMLFRVQFKGRIDEIIEEINIVNKACDEVRSSDRLRKMMAMILTLVNQINTGGDGNLAVGFSLDALLKLNEAKAFDKKTSVLQYLVKLVKQNDESLMDFKNDIESVPAAGGVVLEALGSDVKVLADEVKKVYETAKTEADRLESEGKLRKMSLAELSEQVTVVRQIGGLSHYNQIDHITGRTQMERFASRATSIVDNAVDALEDLKKTYAGVLSYFGEDEKMSSTDFFGTMKKFTLEFESSAETVEKQEKAKLKEKLRAAAKKTVAANRIAGIVKSPSKGKKSAPMTGDVASLAAEQAKVKRVGKEGEHASPESDRDGKKKAPFPSGGIAAMAAAAALKKRQPSVVNDNEPHESSTAANNKDSSVTEDSNETNIEKDPSSISGIAAVAAAAARNRTKLSEDSEPSTSGGPASSSTGGIAAMAAAAAMQRTRKTSDDDSKSEEPADATTAPSVPPFPSGGGIAAAAAQAARKRQQTIVEKDREAEQPTEDSDAPRSPPFLVGGGIAAAAAQAALKRQQAASNEDSKGEEPVCDSNASEAPPFPAGGGIAAAAAQAALKRQQAALNKEESKGEEPVEDSNTSEAPPFPAGGGIAAAAAQAALKRQQAALNKEESKGEEPVEDSNTSEAPPFPAGGGIAAAAAQAALKRQQAALNKEEGKGEEPVGDSNASEAPPFPAGGGIAAAAAQAALKRQQAALKKEESKGEEPAEDSNASEAPPFPAGGGIAAAAAQAALKRQQVASNEVSEAKKPVEGGGITEAAALAAQKRQMISEDTAGGIGDVCTVKNVNSPPRIDTELDSSLGPAAGSVAKKSEEESDTSGIDATVSAATLTVAGQPENANGSLKQPSVFDGSKPVPFKQNENELLEVKPAEARVDIEAAAAASARQELGEGKKTKDILEGDSISDNPAGTAKIEAGAEDSSVANVELTDQSSEREDIFRARPATEDGAMKQATKAETAPLCASVSATKNQGEVTAGDRDSERRLVSESDDEDVFFDSEMSLNEGSRKSCEESRDAEHVSEGPSDSHSQPSISKDIPQSLSSRSHESNEMTRSSPAGSRLSPHSAPVSPEKAASPKSSKGLSKWMPRFGSRTESAHLVQTSTSPDSAVHNDSRASEASASIAADSGSGSKGKTIPMQNILKRAYAKRNLSPRKPGSPSEAASDDEFGA